MNNKWDEVKSKLNNIFLNKSERGKVRGLLLKMKVKERLEYFEGDDEEIKFTLETLLTHEGKLLYMHHNNRFTQT